MKSLVMLGLIVLGSSPLLAQPAERRISRQAYIEMWKDEAIRQMHEYGIPASITLAQGILESANGNSALAKYANNHFGIKCHEWQGATFIQDDDKKDECFRKYNSAEESFKDHSIFLANRKWYAHLFDLKVTDYKGWAYGLKKSGYATNPKYAYLLIELIEAHNLHEFDNAIHVPSLKPKKPKVVENEMTIRVGHSVKIQSNGVAFVIVGDGDTYYKIAKEFDLSLNQLYKYNDLNKESVLHTGDVLYVESKKGRAKTETHIVQKNETMWSISQKYGIKLKKLYKKNNMNPGDEPESGDVVNLRKRKK